jgi:hypothetical protein
MCGRRWGIESASRSGGVVCEEPAKAFILKQSGFYDEWRHRSICVNSEMRPLFDDGVAPGYSSRNARAICRRGRRKSPNVNSSIIGPTPSRILWTRSGWKTCNR